MSETVNHTPAVKFLARPDFFSILHMNQVYLFVILFLSLMLIQTYIGVDIAGQVES